MTKTLLRAGALSCALLASTALTAPAMAQSVYQNIDGNGVDLTDGSYNLSLVEGSIGAGDGAIALMRFHGVGGLSDNLTVRFQRSVSGGTATINLTFGNRLETFSGASGATSFTSGQGEAATLTKIGPSEYLYTDDDGTVTTYGPPPGLTNAVNNGFCSAGAETSCRLIAIQTVRPNGAAVTYQWDVGENCTEHYDQWGEPYYVCAQFWRQRGLSNNFGYRARFAFQQEANPTSGLPPTAWHTRSGATLHNDSVSSTARTISYSYPSSTVTEVITDGGQTWRFARDTAQRLTGIRRPGSAADNIAISYAAPTSLVVSQTVIDGVTTNYSRSVNGSTGTMTRTNALSQVTTVVSNLAIGRPTSVTDAGQTTSFIYDSNGRVTGIWAPELNSVTHLYDSRGNVTQTQVNAKGAALPAMVTEVSFPATCANPVTCNRPLTTTDARGKVTDYEWDQAHGGLLSVTQPAPAGGAVRPQIRYSYAAVNGVTMPSEISVCRTLAGSSSGTPAACLGLADETRTVIGYGANRIPVSVTARAGDNSLTATATTAYSAHGDAVSVDGPIAGTDDTIYFRTDAARRRIGTISPDPDGAGALKRRAVRIGYRPDGQVSAMETGNVNGVTDTDWTNFASLEAAQIEYDANSRPVVQRLVAGGATHALTQTSYDGLGRVQCVAQRMNPAEFASLPSDACTLDTAGSFGPDRIARTTYDAAGRVTLVQAGYGVTGVQADEVATGYTPNGLPETVTDANGNRTTYVYDAHDRLSRTRMPDPSTPGTSSTTDYEELTYETVTIGGVARASPLVVNRRLRDNTNIGHSYDALGRLTARDLPATAWYNIDRAYTYDNLGRLLTANGTGEIAYAYDALGRLTSETSAFGPTSHQYDLAGRRTRLTYTDGFYVTYDRLATGEVTAIREYGASSGPGVLATYVYDDHGRRTLLTRGNGTQTSYTYDAVSRLASLTQSLNGTANDLILDFTHNPASQIATNTRSNDAYSFTPANADVASTADGLNRITAIGSAGVGYDGRGNVYEVPAAGTTTGAARLFFYTSDNALAISVGPDAIYQQMLSDSVERLLRYHDGSAYRFFLYDGQSMVVETNAAATAIARRYVHGPGIDEPLVWYEGAGTTDRRWFHADERGSVVAVSDGSGNVVGTVNRYDEYGVPQGTLTGRFGYTGQPWFSEIGLYHYRARAYNPALGRFMQTDPIGYGSGMNLYAYVLNDPVNFTDPTGLCGVDVCVYGERPHADGAGIFGGAFGGAFGHGAVGTAAAAQEVAAERAQCQQDPHCVTVTARTRPRTRSRTIIFSMPPPGAGFGAPERNPFPRPPSRRRTPDRCSFSPDNPGNVNLRGPCYNHDMCYGSRTPKSVCDSQLFEDIYAECRRSDGDFAGCFFMGFTYYLGVRIGGFFSYSPPGE